MGFGRLELDLVVVVYWSHTVGTCLQPLHNMEGTIGSKRPWMEYGHLGNVGFGVEELHKVHQISMVLLVRWLVKQAGREQWGRLVVPRRWLQILAVVSLCGQLV